MKNLLLYKWTLFNFLAIVWLAGTDYQTKWFSAMFQSDTTRVTWGIAGLFMSVWICTFAVVWSMNKATRNSAFKASRFEWISAAAGWMLFLGLIGTLLGLQISLNGVNTGNLANLDGIKSLAVQMIAGLRIELSSTIIGAMLAMWTEVNYVILKHTADKAYIS